MTDSAQTTGSDDSEIRATLRRMGRRYPIVLATVVLASASAFAFASKSEKEYTATAKLLFRDPAFDQKLFGSSTLAPSRDPVREAATNVTLTSLDVVFERAARVLRRGRLDGSDVRRMVRVAPEGQADVVAVSATHSDPDFSAMIANTVSREYILFRRDADRAKITEAIASVRSKLASLTAEDRSRAEGRSVRGRIGQLEILASLQTGNAELVQPASAPTLPSSPRPFRDAILAAIGGIILGVGLAIVIDRIDRRVRTAGEFESILQRPILGLIPKSRAYGRGDGVLPVERLDSEAFRTLRTNLRFFATGRDVRSLLITSSAPGDGKSTVARCLAATAAASGVSVVLVETDFRRPTLQRLFRELSGAGLADVLAGDVTLRDAIQPLQLYDKTSTDGATLDVVVAGPLPPNPADLVESDRMCREIMREFHASYDLVILDTPPLIVVPDAIPLLSQVSGIAVVGRAARHPRRTADVTQTIREPRHFASWHHRERRRPRRRRR